MSKPGFEMIERFRILLGGLRKKHQLNDGNTHLRTFQIEYQIELDFVIRVTSDLFLKFRFLRKPQKFGLPLRFDVTKCKITPNLCGLLKKPEL